MDTLIQKELLKTLRQMQRRRSDDVAQNFSDDGQMRPMKGLAGCHRLRRQVLQRPAAVFKEHVSSVREKLAVTREKHLWSFRD